MYLCRYLCIVYIYIHTYYIYIYICMQYIPCTFILCIHVADVVDMMWNMLDTVDYAYIVHV